MDVWVQNVKTKEAWILNNDKSKPVYNDDNGTMQLDLENLGLYRFYPCNPNMTEQEKDGYQFNIFDYLKEDE